MHYNRGSRGRISCLDAYLQLHFSPPLFVAPDPIQQKMSILTIFGHFWPSGQYACSLGLSVLWECTEYALRLGVHSGCRSLVWWRRKTGNSLGLQFHQVTVSPISIFSNKRLTSPPTSSYIYSILILHKDAMNFDRVLLMILRHRAGGEIHRTWSAIWPCVLNSSDGRLEQQKDDDTFGGLMLSQRFCNDTGYDDKFFLLCQFIEWL